MNQPVAASGLRPTIHELVVPLAAVVVQLALALVVIWRFQLESRTFFNVMALVSAGFVVHAPLPSSSRSAGSTAPG
jgi:hypothetical protein